jgi:hypothetical protein
MIDLLIIEEISLRKNLEVIYYWSTTALSAFWDLLTYPHDNPVRINPARESQLTALNLTE